MADNNERNAKGEGGFTSNANGTVTHRKSVGYKPNGKRKVLTVTAATKAACIRKMKQKEKKWNEEKEKAHVRLNNTITELCRTHLEYQMKNNDLKHKAIDRRECTIKNQIDGYDLGGLQVGVITSTQIEEHIELLLKEDKVGESSIIKVVDLINAAFAWAIRRGDLKENPVLPIKQELVKKIKNRTAKGADEADVNVLSDKEVKLFEEEAMLKVRDGKQKYPAADYLLFLLYTGLRVGEMLALRWRDWDGGYLTIDKSISMAKNRGKQDETENNYIPIEGSTKNQKARVIELTNEAKWILQKIKNSRDTCDKDDFIVITRTGKLNTASNLEHRMKVIMKNAGLDDVKGGLHTFRKTFATRMYENGARVEEIAAYIGDLESTTRKYYIAIRKKVFADGEVRQVVKLPGIEKIRKARAHNRE